MILLLGLSCNQIQEGTKRDLGYMIANHSIVLRSKKELLAIVAKFDHLDIYLSCVSEPFLLSIDNRALTWLKTMACSNKAMLLWCDAVKKYSFIIQHRSGAQHQNTDALSRVRLARCSWDHCPDCKPRLSPLQTSMRVS